jgi:hypothetical protein
MKKRLLKSVTGPTARQILFGKRSMTFRDMNERGASGMARPQTTVDVETQHNGDSEGMMDVQYYT